MKRLTERVINDVVNKLILEASDNQRVSKSCKRFISEYINAGNTLSTDDVDVLYNKFLNEIYHNPQLKNSKLIVLASLFCRILFSECGFESSSVNYDKINRLKQIFSFIVGMSQCDGGEAEQMECKRKQLELITKIRDTQNSGNLYTFDRLNSLISEYEKEEGVLNKKGKKRKISVGYKYEVIGPLCYDGDDEEKNKEVFNFVETIGEFSCPKSTLCFTVDMMTWVSSYLQNGQNKAYILIHPELLKMVNTYINNKEFTDDDIMEFSEDYPELYFDEHTDDGIFGSRYNGYDSYGMSMIFLFVNKKGELITSHTRWNHSGEYLNKRDCDHAFTKAEIKQLLTDEQYKMIFGKSKRRPSDFQKLIDKGYQLKEIFDRVRELPTGIKIVEYRKKFNIVMSDNKLLWKPKELKLWFDVIFDDKDSIYFYYNNKQCIIKMDNLSEEILNNPENWFDKILAMYGNTNMTIVRRGNKMNLYDLDKCKVVYQPHNIDLWFDYIKNNIFGDYNHQYSHIYKVEKNGKYNIFSTKINDVVYEPKKTELWFDYIGVRCLDKYFECSKNNKFTIMDINLNIIWQPKRPDLWFDKIRGISGNKIFIKINDKCNYITTDGKMPYSPKNINKWFDDMGPFINNVAIVRVGSKYNLLSDINNKIIWAPNNTELWFDEIPEKINTNKMDNDYYGGFKCYLNGFKNFYDWKNQKFAITDKTGKPLWIFNELEYEYKDKYLVYKNRHNNIWDVNEHCLLIRDKNNKVIWVSDITKFKNGWFMFEYENLLYIFHPRYGYFSDQGEVYEKELLKKFNQFLNQEYNTNSLNEIINRLVKNFKLI